MSESHFEQHMDFSMTQQEPPKPAEPEVPAAELPKPNDVMLGENVAERQAILAQLQSETPDLGPEDHENALRMIERAQESERVLSAVLERLYPERASVEKEHAAIERELQGEIVEMQELGGGKNTPLRIRLEGGREAVFKPRGRDVQVRFGIQPGEYAGREWLAFQIDRALRLDIVPHTTLRDVPQHEVGSVQVWSEGKVALLDRDWKSKADVRTTETLALFDTLVMSSDRNEGNFLVDADQGGRVVAIDNGLVLSSEEKSDHFRSAVLEEGVCAGKELSLENAERLEAFLASPELQQALNQAFGAVLGEHATKLWDGFIARVKKYAAPNAKLPESKRTGNGVKFDLVEHS